MDATKKFGLTRFNKYSKHDNQLEIKLDWPHDWILILVTFVRHLQKIYNKEKVTQNKSFK